MPKQKTRTLRDDLLDGTAIGTEYIMKDEGNKIYTALDIQPYQRSGFRQNTEYTELKIRYKNNKINYRNLCHHLNDLEFPNR